MCGNRRWRRASKVNWCVDGRCHSRNEYQLTWCATDRLQSVAGPGRKSSWVLHSLLRVLIQEFGHPATQGEEPQRVLVKQCRPTGLSRCAVTPRERRLLSLTHLSFTVSISEKAARIIYAINKCCLSYGNTTGIYLCKWRNGEHKSQHVQTSKMEGR